MKCLIFAAGLGTRLKPLTDTMPKAMVPISGKPLLEHCLRKLAQAGFAEAVVNVHHFAEQIIDFVQNNDFGISVKISDERGELLETGGGIKKAAELLGKSEPFFVHNVDILSNLDLADFYKHHQPDDLATLLVSNRATNRYLLFDQELRLVGWTNIQTGEVRTPYERLDIQQCTMRAFSGIHVVSPRIFDLMQTWHGKFSIIDFYLSVCRNYQIRACEIPDFQMIDVGKLDSLGQAETFLQTH